MEVHEHINMDKFLAKNLPNCHVLKFTNDGGHTLGRRRTEDFSGLQLSPKASKRLVRLKCSQKETEIT